MAIISDIQAIGKILQKAGNISLYEKLLAIQEKTLEIMEENNNLRKEIDKLKEELRIKNLIEFKDDVYWMKNEEGRVVDGPFCSKSYDAEKNLIHLTSLPGYEDLKQCRNCRQVFPVSSSQ